MLTAVFALLMIPAPGPPAGLLLSGGAEIARDGGPSIPAAPGELLYPGDIVTARQSVRLLSCPDSMMGSLPAGITANVEAGGIRAPHWTSRKEIGACFLPLVNKGPVGGAKHLGAMVIRSMEIPNPDTRESRIQALDPARREIVARHLAQLEGETPEACVMRGALFQRNRLHLDAKQEYEAALKQWPKASWLKVLIVAADDALLRAR
jgi:hypothetical protein